MNINPFHWPALVSGVVSKTASIVIFLHQAAASRVLSGCLAMEFGLGKKWCTTTTACHRKVQLQLAVCISIDRLISLAADPV